MLNFINILEVQTNRNATDQSEARVYSEYSENSNRRNQRDNRELTKMNSKFSEQLLVQVTEPGHLRAFRQISK